MTRKSRSPEAQEWEESEPPVVKEAEKIVTAYAYGQVCEPFGKIEHNLLTAALNCGCKSCIAAYIEMVRFLAGGDEKVAEEIICSHLGPPPYGR